jgi:ketosteroid isomerase-like protein
MPTATPATDEAQIRECLNKWTRALHAKNLAALTALYSPDTIAFDLMPPSQVDASHYRQNLERWLTSMQSPIEYEIHDLRIVAGGDVAFSHNLGHVKATRANGEQADYWVRATVGFRRHNGQWLVTHDHVSMPFDMETGKAVRELRR